MVAKPRKFVALVPARSGSRRVPNKNLLLLDGKTLIQRSIDASREVSQIESTYIVTDSVDYELEAISHGAKSLGLRPAEISGSSSLDIEWIRWATDLIAKIDPDATHYVVLRPTSPFRSASLIEKAIAFYESSIPSAKTVLRSVQPVKEHPGKMWVEDDLSYMKSLLGKSLRDMPWSDHQTQSLPQVWVQNACIDIGSFEGIKKGMPTSGEKTLMFECLGIETLDINVPEDVELAELYIAKGIVK